MATTYEEPEEAGVGVYTMGIILWILYGIGACLIGSAATLAVLWLLRGCQLPAGY